MLAALAGVPASVIFTTGPGIDLDRVGDPGENIVLESFVPQSLIIPRADLVVSHAGLGTIIGALYAGVPMVLISIAVDHPINAERAAALGVARVLDRSSPWRDGGFRRIRRWLLGFWKVLRVRVVSTR